MAEELYSQSRRRPDADAPPSWLGAQQEEARACAFCGEVPPPASSFCHNCGRGLTAALLPQQGEGATVLFTDIEDSTHLTEQLGDLQWESIIDEHNDIIRHALDRHAGFEVKQTGDGFLIVFADSLQAVRCAAEVQEQVTDRFEQRGADWPVKVRMGVHRGDVILRPGGDILGRTVNMAARVMDRARGEWVMASKPLKEHAGRHIGPEYWQDAGARRLKGLDGRHRIYRFRWREFLQEQRGEQDAQPRPSIQISPANLPSFAPVPRKVAVAPLDS